MQIDHIIKAAETAHEKHWQATSDESTGTKQATDVTKAWQEAVRSEHIKTEVRVADDLNEKIDVVDFSTATAYEMKVSGKNPHHEFYKDIFKIIVYNRRHSEKMLKRLLFITEKHNGTSKLNTGLAKAVTELMEELDVPFNLDIKVVGI